MGGDVATDAGPGRDAVRAAWGIDAEAPLVLYTGTFEQYQGLDLLLDAAARAARDASRRRACWWSAGRPSRWRAAREGRAQRPGRRWCSRGSGPPHEIPHFVDACDILVSPRISGTNTPLKIYSYLRSGRPIVATNLHTHTQVLSRRRGAAGGADARRPRARGSRS